jgi:hypothetical protein
MNGKFYLAAIPEPYRILGLRLKPFSAGHILLLNRIENAFVTEATIDEAQLASAVFICSRSSEDGLASRDESKGTNAFMRSWRRELNKKRATVDLPAAIKLFSDYIRNGSNIPTYATKGEEGKPHRMDVPAIQVVKCSLLKTFGGMTESEFLNRPWGLCLWDFVTIRGIEGSLEVYQDDAIANAQAVGERLEELVKQGKLNGKV